MMIVLNLAGKRASSAIGSNGSTVKSNVATPTESNPSPMSANPIRQRRVTNRSNDIPVTIDDTPRISATNRSLAQWHLSTIDSCAKTAIKSIKPSDVQLSSSPTHSIEWSPILCGVCRNSRHAR